MIIIHKCGSHSHPIPLQSLLKVARSESNSILGMLFRENWANVRISWSLAMASVHRASLLFHSVDRGGECVAQSIPPSPLSCAKVFIQITSLSMVIIYQSTIIQCILRALAVFTCESCILGLTWLPPPSHPPIQTHGTPRPRRPLSLPSFSLLPFRSSQTAEQSCYRLAKLRGSSINSS